MKFIRGKRVRKLRVMTGLSRAQIQKKYFVSRSSLEGWEEGKSGGLTEKGAEKLVKIFEAEGIICTKEWLLHGEGENPKIVEEIFFRDLS